MVSVTHEKLGLILEWWVFHSFSIGDVTSTPSHGSISKETKLGSNWKSHPSGEWSRLAMTTYSNYLKNYDQLWPSLGDYQLQQDGHKRVCFKILKPIMLYISHYSHGWCSKCQFMAYPQNVNAQYQGQNMVGYGHPWILIIHSRENTKNSSKFMDR